MFEEAIRGFLILPEGAAETKLAAHDIAPKPTVAGPVRASLHRQLASA
jgi:hypothetical protein